MEGVSNGCGKMLGRGLIRRGKLGKTWRRWRQGGQADTFGAKEVVDHRGKGGDTSSKLVIDLWVPLDCLEFSV